MTRYALYFAPAPDTSWWSAGCRWLGRDAVSGAEFPQSPIDGVSHLLFAKLTANARRYGFHATLKAPFCLADGFSEDNLLTMAQAFSAVQAPITLEQMQVNMLGDFLALRPSDQIDALRTLANRCVSYFSLLRAPLTEVELERRRSAHLSVRQDALLQRWGYPYTEEEFNFHMTLTDGLRKLDTDSVQTIRSAAEAHFATTSSAPVIDALTIFRESVPGAPFIAWRRFPFMAREQNAELPDTGRLFFVVGPSGVGKDTLLQWVKEKIPADTDIVFAKRTITRPSHWSEPHEAVDETTFLRLAADGHFAMTWQANGLCYGIRRNIEADLKAGRDVIINGSREYVTQLQENFPDAHIVWIEANAGVIRDRIETRQRESGALLLQRVERITQFTPPLHRQVIRLDNNGSVQAVGQRLLDLLTKHERSLF